MGDEILNAIIGHGSIWYLMGAALVFFMQAGFAMVETGFTRQKNACNIIMKNLMDFCIGTCVFMLIGYPLLNGPSGSGFAGWGPIPLLSFESIDWSDFVFNLVFCATAATIVSGAMAERTKFISYCIYSLIISLVIYPIEAHWVWGVDAAGEASGWLAKMGFVDWAGSAAIHTVGGVSALVGAALLGPRIGKFNADGKPLAIPGHNIVIGALGVFILWFGWYGFNGAAAGDITQLAQIFGTTTIAAAVATVTVMIFTWLKDGKPDVGMALNGSLAGLVAITAGCASVDGIGATVIGIVAGLLVYGAVKFVDNVLKVDDPVGAIAVHGACGIFGTIAVGLFDCGVYWEDGVARGLFYGGGFKQLGLQCLGILSIIAWTAVTMGIVFLVIRKTIGLRVSEAEELAGLDTEEHGYEGYPDFVTKSN